MGGRSGQIIALALCILGLLGAAAAGGPAEGMATIHCWTGLVFGGDGCAPVEGYSTDALIYDVGAVNGVTLTIDWTPNSVLTQELRLTISGGERCQDPVSPCTAAVQGKSPLSVTLTGEGAGNTTVGGFATSPEVCDYHHPPPAPVNLYPIPSPTSCSASIQGAVIVHQTYHYVWTTN